MKTMRKPAARFRVDDQFWGPRIHALRTATLPQQLRMLEKHGYFDNFRRAARRESGGFHGFVYHDSDLYKVLEAACHYMRFEKDSSFASDVEDIVNLIAQTQLNDGYLNTHFQLMRPEMRWTNLRDDHELYCSGHLIEAAVAHFAATGTDTLLNVAVRCADHIVHTFLGKEGYPGHPEVELALLKLWRVTNREPYLELARQFVFARGSGYFAKEHGTPLHEYDGRYWQDHAPLTDWKSIEGHAVRALYYLCAATELAGIESNPQIEQKLQTLWQDTISKRTYVTGGVGSSASNEGFTQDYDLPNAQAYQETCASIALAMWSHRMAMLFGEAKYIDAVECALYNAVLAGISLDGTQYFYVNPLEAASDHRRKEWFECACCPPNIARTLAQIGTYAVSESEDAITVDLFIAGIADTRFGELRVETEYPWKGDVTITPPPGDYLLRVRQPRENQYWEVPRKDIEKTFQVNLDVSTRVIHPHPKVAANKGKIAIARGPLVFCQEDCDPETLIPYYRWANREPCGMRVWLDAD